MQYRYRVRRDIGQVRVCVVLDTKDFVAVQFANSDIRRPRYRLLWTRKRDVEFATYS